MDWLAAANPHKIALVIGGQQWTYAELDIHAKQYADHLKQAGVTAGQMVGVLMPNGFEYVCLIHALSRLGAVLVPLNTRLTARELDWQLLHVDCTLLICSAETASLASNFVLPNRRVLSVHEPQFPAVQFLFRASPVQIRLRPQPLGLVSDGVNLPAPRRKVSEEMENTIQAIVFTSGTTGNPKGVMLTTSNFFWSAAASAFRLGTLPSDRWLCCLPLYHVGGLSILFRCCLYSTTVVLHNGFDVESVNQALDTQDITLISLVPTMLHRLFKTRTEFPASLRLILLGGAAASSALLAQSAHLPVALTYGLSEACSQVATAFPDGKKAGSVGKPLLFTSVRIVNESGDSLPPEEYGEVVVSGPTVMRGYYGQPPLSGEFYTGDIGYLDSEGDLFIVQRRSDLILSGGENIYPSEVEQVLRQHPAVAEVCVVGLEHPEWGQQVAAAIVLKTPASEEEILTFSRAFLAGYKQPRRLLFVESLPQTASGKVQRQAVMELFT
ncbi:MAG: o-succinylbenzoate--CoA ligase [Anaerolineae bacterium]|nr:o-succinylbenzoate--CoA ligase [Anaerolineae bacterium]